MTKKARFLRIPKGQDEGLYELTDWKRPISLETVPNCPCCETRLTPGYDICQWGMFEDKYTSYLLCKSCGKAFELLYTVPTYVYLTAKEQKRVLRPSKKSVRSTVANDSERSS